MQQTLLRGGTGCMRCAAQVSGSGWQVDVSAGNFVPAHKQHTSQPFTAACHLTAGEAASHSAGGAAPGSRA